MDAALPRPHDAEPAAVRFRPSKKRKTYRQPRPHPDGLSPWTAEPDEPADGGDDDADDAGRVAAVRLRCDPRRGTRFRGLGFAAQTRVAGDALAVGTRGARGPDAEDDRALGGIADRFMHQTGLVADPDDRHMTDYIESRLSSRAAPSSPLPKLPAAAPLPAAAASASGDPSGEPPAPSAASALRAGDQPTKHGKLFEVDIPADVRSRRDDARRRLAERAPRPRPARNRRGSDDMKRDEFVEQFLHENRLDVYDFPKQSAAIPPPSSSTDAAAADQRTADDRMAEQFRRQYLDDLAQRRQRRRHAHPPRQQPPPGDVLRGPKLGGSRNSRAAVRNLLLQQEKEKVGRKV